MAKKQVLKIFYDSMGNTLNVWFDDPKKEKISEETDDDVILNKDKDGNVIGFEKLNFTESKMIMPKVLPVEII